MQVKNDLRCLRQITFMFYQRIMVVALENGALEMDSEELTKCYEPLQKLRVRLGTCKTGLSPPVTLCY